MIDQPSNTQSTDVVLNGSQTNPFAPAFFSLLLGVFILSFAAIFTRLSENELAPSATIFNRYYIAVIALLLWNLVQSRISNSPQPSEVIQSKDWAFLLLSSILGTGANFLWALSLTQTNVANSNLLHNLTPIFAVFGGWLFLRQSFDYKFLLGVVLAIAGAAIIGFGDFQQVENSLIGDSLALISAIFYAFNYLVREKLRYKFSATTILLWTCLFCGCFAFLLTATTQTKFFPTSWQTWLAVICLAVLCQVMGQGLLIHNLKRSPSGFVTLLMLLEPLLTALFAWVIFAEQLTLFNWIGFFLVLGGIYLAKQNQGLKQKF